MKIGRLRISYVSRQPRSTRAGARIGSLIYQCNICGETCETNVRALGRETPSCPSCRSTVRMRGIVHLLSMELFGESLPLSRFPAKPDIVGIGLSDWEAYAVPLARRLGYRNTYYHQEPRLDITAIDPALEGTLDFLISTDVFEHIAPPVGVAFENCFRLLKPKGVMIFSVPYVLEGETVEHFPELHQYEVVDGPGGRVLRNVTRDGREQLFDSLVFHGGVGDTLEMRLFSESSLMLDLARAGFTQVTAQRAPCFEHGIYWWNDSSLLMTVRK